MKQNFGPEKIEQVLNSLDHTAPVPAPDFFYTRLAAKMGAGHPIQKRTGRLQPALITGCLLVFAIANIYSIMQFKTGHKTTEPQQIQKSATISDFADAYNL